MDIELSQSGNGGHVAARVGDRLRLTLLENPTTGYQWSLVLSEPRLAVVESHEYLPVDRSLGGGGYAVWALNLLAAGTLEIQAELRRPWQSNVAPAEQFSATVEIEDGT